MFNLVKDSNVLKVRIQFEFNADFLNNRKKLIGFLTCWEINNRRILYIAMFDLNSLVVTK